MNEFIKNILNPPSEYSEKQIWYSDEAKKEFLIISAPANEELFKVVLLSRVTELEDSIDIILRKSDFQFLASDRIALRFSTGPLHKNQLTYYLGTINSESFEKIKSSLKKTNVNYYDEIQKRVLADILEELEPLRQHAIELYENSIREPAIIFKLPTVDASKQEDEIPFKIHHLAADDANTLVKEFNFWDNEENDVNKSQTILKDEKIWIKLSEINGNLYLIIYTSEQVSISDVVIEQNGKTISAEPNKVNIGEDDRTALFFDKNKFSNGDAELRLVLNGIQQKIKIKFE
jgi:hypothetical protein